MTTTQSTTHVPRAFDYVTNKATETVHLIGQNPAASQTLCGQKVAMATHAWGDETVSGIAATCAKCKSVIDRINA